MSTYKKNLWKTERETEVRETATRKKEAEKEDHIKDQSEDQQRNKRSWSGNRWKKKRRKREKGKEKEKDRMGTRWNDKFAFTRVFCLARSGPAPASILIDDLTSRMQSYNRFQTANQPYELCLHVTCVSFGPVSPSSSFFFLFSSDNQRSSGRCWII